MKNIDLPDGRTIIVDRKSWIFKVEERTPMFYSLDQLGLPRNPMVIKRFIRFIYYFYFINNF